MTPLFSFFSSSGFDIYSYIYFFVKIMKFLSIYILSLVLFYPSLNSVLCHLNVGNKCSQSCLACENGQCLKCERGLYSFENQCLETCPLSSVADNISFKCLNKSQNPLYAKAFTVSRCMNSCGKVFADCRYIQIELSKLSHLVRETR